jgi:hypothetical protein
MSLAAFASCNGMDGDLHEPVQMTLSQAIDEHRADAFHAYQLDLTTPGRRPSSASLRKQMRQRLNLRM